MLGLASPVAITLTVGPSPVHVWRSPNVAATLGRGALAESEQGVLRGPEIFRKSVVASCA